MKLDDVKKGLRVTITHLWPPNSFSVVQKNLDCRKEGVTGVVIGHVPGHGGDVWWVKHDGTNDVGAYRFTEFETIDHDLVPAYSVLENVIDERNALRDEVAELKRKLAEVEGERDALRECGVKLYVLYDLNSILYMALENIANQGHALDGSTNADLAKRALKLYEDRAK